MNTCKTAHRTLRNLSFPISISLMLRKNNNKVLKVTIHFCTGLNVDYFKEENCRTKYWKLSSLFFFWFLFMKQRTQLIARSMKSSKVSNKSINNPCNQETNHINRRQRKSLCKKLLTWKAKWTFRMEQTKEHNNLIMPRQMKNQWTVAF